MEYKFCGDCKHYVHESKDSAYMTNRAHCKLDASQTVYLFTECLIGKWEPKDDRQETN